MATPELHRDPRSPASGTTRREVLARGAAGSLGLALSGSLGLLFGGPAAAAGKGVGYGPLLADPMGLLALPEGFSYTVVAETGVTMLETGQKTPSDPDGMAAFVRRGGAGSVLVYNHEISGSEAHPVPALPELTFNPAARGGCTNIEVDADGNRIREWVSIAGTHNNCAGGRTPWNTWLTCEETESTVGGVRHGYVFEVDPYDREANKHPKPIRAMGRFAHESVAVDPETGAIYETEDASNPNGLFFRFVPPAEALPLDKGVLRTLADDAGTLDAMRASSRGTHVADLSVATDPGTTYDVEWITVPDRDGVRLGPVRRQAFAKPITRSRKLEGMWWGDGGAYFVASFARSESAVPHDGQVWFYDPSSSTIELKLYFKYTQEDQDSDVDGPDTITVSPYGGVIVAEDGQGKQHLVGSTDGGETFFLARNEASGGEFAGPTFSRDKKTLFAVVQSPGRVFAIRGPWVKQK